MADVKEPEEITQKGLDFGDGHSSLPSLEQPVQQPGKINVTDSRPRFWVEIPFIQSKDLYKELDLDMADAAEENTPVEIVGEIRVQTHVQYWVRHENDIVYRHPSRSFKSAYPELLAVYEVAKTTGALPKFNPESTQVHPKHRYRPVIKVPPFTKVGPPRGGKRVVPTRASRLKEKRMDIKTSSQSEFDEDDSDEDAFEGDTENSHDDLSDLPRKKGKKPIPQPTRRSGRSAAKNNSYREASLSPLKTRSGTQTAIALDETEQSDESENDSEEETPKPKEKRLRGRLSRPAYGNIRLIADLSEDESDDDYPIRAHRNICDKCQEPPAHISLNKYYAKLKRKRRGRKVAPDEEEENRLQNLGGWVRCLKCTVGIHWKCLSKAQRDEIIKAARRRDEEAEKEGLNPRKLGTLGAYDTTDFFCSACIQGGICMYCREVALTPERLPELKSTAQAKDISNIPQSGTASSNNPDDVSVALQDSLSPGDQHRELLFRCKTCKRLAHYEHFPQPLHEESLSIPSLAEYYQNNNDWQCTDCVAFIYPLDKILAWRPYPANAVEPDRQPGQLPDHKALLPREYLVKWLDRSYRRVQWVPHMWLLSTSAAKLKNFLATGAKVVLLNAPSEQHTASREQSMDADLNFLIADDTAKEASSRASIEHEHGPPGPLPDAEHRISPRWKTIDRVLDIRIWNPSKSRPIRAKSSKKKRIESESENESDPELEEQRTAAYMLGQEPKKQFLDTIDQWETRAGKAMSPDQASDIIWAYVKWSELGYEDATWDAPPLPSEPGYVEFEQAFKRFLEARKVFIVKKSRKDTVAFDNRPKAAFDRRELALTADPELGQEGKLMEFQLSGVNWLFRNWWRLQPSILADDMGLGKTVQASTLVGYLAKNYDASPALIVVPNSTIMNWMRELTRWAPGLRVVPYYGDAKARDIIRHYELYHDNVVEGYTKLKFHVLLTTYDTIIGREFSTVFKSVPRWELLIVDEGQRLKNDASLLFKRLNELNSIHRILMTGTPLNNNIRELFNLMNFLDPEKWDDVEALEKEHESITEELLTALHERLKPYFLRRTKADVLKLPPKNEVIVPLSMSSLQKEVYKSLLSRNIHLIRGLVQPSKVKSSSSGKLGLRNMLMDLRKCLQHPYLVQPELEPQGPELTSAMVHKNLVDASCKLRTLQMMLPKLKARGHRVLLFSQFVIALNIIEDFLAVEGYKFLRLDGDTKQLQRQKDMDAFNQPNSDYFIYILSTRAGGVGINLWSADTIIIFDPDFNPHQDLQAISRAHRYGQQKTVLVFKFMVKSSAEERIIQTGKKKLALDHLIVQKMDEEEVSSDLQSILTFGAKALFEESEVSDINYTEADIEKLIIRTEEEGDKVTEDSDPSSFGFAKLWTADKDALEEVQEDTAQDQDTTFWDAVLAKVTEERAVAAAAEVTGRGAKRRAATTIKKYVFGVDSPAKPKDARRASKSSDNSDVPYSQPESISDSERSLMSNASDVSLRFEIQPGLSTSAPEPKPKRLKKSHLENNVWDDGDDDDDEKYCGLCQTRHRSGQCFMTQDPRNLVDYREMLLKESTEPLRLRRNAVHAIDSRLATLGLLHLVKGQGNIFVDNQAQLAGPRKRNSSVSSTQNVKKLKLNNGTSYPSPPTCIICNGPYHLVKSCPMVRAGANSISEAIERLSQMPHVEPIINILKSHLQATE